MVLVFEKLSDVSLKVFLRRFLILDVFLMLSFESEPTSYSVLLFGKTILRRFPIIDVSFQSEPLSTM